MADPGRAVTPAMSDRSANEAVMGAEENATGRGQEYTGEKLDLSTLITHQEVFLRILGFMNAAELAGVQGVNRYWQTMSLDQQLWKKLYLSRYPHPHHTRLTHGPTLSIATPRPANASGAASLASASPRSFRPISRLPSRAFPPPSPSPTPPRRALARRPSGSEGLKEQVAGDISEHGPCELSESIMGNPLVRDAGGGVPSDDRAIESVRSVRTAGLPGTEERLVRAPELAGKGKGRAMTFVRPAVPHILGVETAAGASVKTEAERSGDGIGDLVPELGSGVRHEGVDWKMLLRLGTNWSTGSASQSATITLPPSPSPSTTSASDHYDVGSGYATPPSNTHLDTSLDDSDSGHSRQHLALSPHLIFTSSPMSPLVQVYSSLSSIIAEHTHPSRARSDERADSAVAPFSHLGIIPPPPGWSSPHRPDNISAITVDQSICQDVDFGGDDVGVDDTTGQLGVGAGSCRLAVFYESGGIVVLRVHTNSSRSSAGPMDSIRWTREMIQVPTSRPASLRRRATTYEPVHGDQVVLAQLYWPVLITCTRAFHVSIYSLSVEADDDTGIRGTSAGGFGRMTRLRTLHSDVSFHPASLSLFPADTTTTTARTGPTGLGATGPVSTARATYKAALTYCTPVYPSSWTVAVQELDIDLSPTSSPLTAWSHRSSDIVKSSYNSHGSVHRASLFHVARSRNAYSPDADSDAEAFAWPRPIRPIPSVKGIPRGIGSDGRWCVIAGKDEQIEVFGLPDVGSDASTPTSGMYRQRGIIGRREDGIVHVQTLHLQGGVAAMELVAGKCVVAGRDGRVVVWDLDRLAEVDAGGNEEGDEERGRQGWMGGRMLGYVEILSSRPTKRSNLTRLSNALQPAAKHFKRAASSGVSNDRSPASRNQLNLSDLGDHPITMKSEVRKTSDVEDDEDYILPHPAAITAAARAFFLPLPPAQVRDLEKHEVKEVLHHVAFDEEKIVGMVRVVQPGTVGAQDGGMGGEGMKVWSFV